MAVLLFTATPKMVGRTPAVPMVYWRLALGLTREDLAAVAGIHPETVARFERREHKPNKATAAALAEALEVPVRDLFPEGVHGGE